MNKYQVFRILYNGVTDAYEMESCPLKNSKSNIAVFDYREEAVAYIYGEYKDYGFNTPVTIVELFIV